MRSSQPPQDSKKLSRREREIMELLHRLGEAAVSDVQKEMVDSPSYSTVRALLGILEEKGHVTHRDDGTRYVYRPKVETAQAGKSALGGVLRTFFGGRIEDAVAALLTTSDQELSDEELERLEETIRRFKENRP